MKGSHQGQNVTFLAIVERLDFKNFYCRSYGLIKRESSKAFLKDICKVIAKLLRFANWKLVRKAATCRTILFLMNSLTDILTLLQANQ